MASNYSIDSTDGVVIVSFSERPHKDELRECIDEAAKRTPLKA